MNYTIEFKDNIAIEGGLIMNENIDLTKILKDCPKGTKLYSTIFGTVKFDRIKEGDEYPIVFITIQGDICNTLKDGRCYKLFDGECTLFPSKEQRSWSKFTAPWYKKERFDPKELSPFDKVLARDDDSEYWSCQLFSYIVEDEVECPYSCVSNFYNQCIPYNDDTKHLVGTTEEAPEFYRYWEE